VRLLLDTHVLLWATATPERLTQTLRHALAAPGNTVFVSAVSVWEIAIKRALGRIVFPLEELDTILARAGFEDLPIAAVHAIAAGGLPRHHADPFDRMLIAQARVEDLTLVSEDGAFGAYDVRLFDAGPGR
jgi:PIN domain nuclease of toxin-antitoxin system